MASIVDTPFEKCLLLKKLVTIQIFFTRVYNTSKTNNFSRKDAKTQRKDGVVFMILLPFFASFLRPASNANRYGSGAALREMPCF